LAVDLSVCLRGNPLCVVMTHVTRVIQSLRPSIVHHPWEFFNWSKIPLSNTPFGFVSARTVEDGFYRDEITMA
jgi:hypothetical protein